MKQIIQEVNDLEHVFYLVIEGRKIGFHLTKRLAKTFWVFLDRGVLVDFEIGPRRKRMKKSFVYQVAFFRQIINLQPYRVYYNIDQLREDMKKVITHQKYYLFIDFEMTMPGYQSPTFIPEIIQAGYMLSKAKGETIIDEGYYVLPLIETTLSRRTQKFLNLDELNFYESAIHYDDFYQKLQAIIGEYHPKLVVWGKNDISALNDSYRLHQKEPLTKLNDFIDLLKLHKDYFNLKDDLGLFKAYQAYYDVDEAQAHDARDDAHITKQVFDAFIEYI